MAVAVTAAAVVTGLVTSTDAGAAPAGTKLAPGVKTSDAKLTGGQGTNALNGLPAGVPKKGTYSFLLQLDTASTATVQRTAQRQSGKAAGKSAAKKQLGRIRTEQTRVAGDLPANSRVLYRTHSALSAVAVRTNVANYDRLTKIGGVTAVYPIAPKKPTNSYAVPFQGAPQAWEAYGDRGQNATIGIIDTGIDYTHADFGGSRDTADYETAQSAAQQTNPTVFPTDKVIGGYDLVGDDYNADPASESYQPVPKPDANPLDCNGHGSHVAGSAAGFGENGDGTTYTGAYDTNTPFTGMKIGPGMAPLAKLYAFRVFGCDGSTDVTGAAIERAIDPNQDGDTSDHVDVANLSLGSDFSSPQDADTVLVKKATDAGVTMVISSGNNGDLYDTGGSPGNAPSALTVAASQDAQAVVDALNITDPAAAQYAAERSIAYDWATKPDLAGSVYKLSSANPYGCQPLAGADADNAKGKIVFVEWNDSAPECGSVARSGNIAAAGGTGFIFGSNAENFSAGITGSAAIPGVLVAKSGADAIRGQLAGGQTVTVGSTEANGVKQDDPALNDTLTDFSSRGIRGADNVKPDVTAVGGTVFSAAVGTGSDGVNESGTSMAAPMTAGLAGLVASQHPDWTAEQVKANIMNTAGTDITTEANGDGLPYAPNRVGSGRIDAKQALDNDVLAYVTGTGADGKPLTGVVSASFGPVAVTADTSQQRTIKVQNTGLSTRSYDVDYTARTEVPGVTYSVSPASVTVPARSSKTVTLTMTVDYSALTKTIDPTVDRETPVQTAGGSVDLPREYVADASGLVTFTSDGDVPSLRVPVYSAPRPASKMTQASSLTMPGGVNQDALLPLTGQRVNQGSGEENVTSIVAGFGLQGTSGQLPTCTSAGQTACVHFPDERSADLRYVGATTSSPQLKSVGENPYTSGNGLAYFSVTTWGPWRTPAGFQDAEVYIDSTGDGKADVVTYSTRLTSGADQTDIMVATTQSLTLKNPDGSPKVLDVEGINDRFGDTDTALFDSDTLVLPVALGALPGLSASKPRIRYSVLTYTGSSAGQVDQIGDVAGDLTLVKPMTLNTNDPGLAVYGSYNGDSSPLLYADSPGSVLKVHRNSKSYQLDGTKGALLIHFQNTVGTKAQMVSLSKGRTTAKLTMTPNPATKNKALSGTVTVTSADGVPLSGTVTLKRLTAGPATVGTPVALKNGTAKITYTPRGSGSYKYQAVYAGDGYSAGSSSNVVTVTIR
ncbi:S8 family serine peptidase [Jatrophihabitans fulvus]